MPVLVMQGDDDQIVPCMDAAPAKLAEHGMLSTRTYRTGLCTTQSDIIKAKSANGYLSLTAG